MNLEVPVAPRDVDRHEDVCYEEMPSTYDRKIAMLEKEIADYKVESNC